MTLNFAGYWLLGFSRATRQRSHPQTRDVFLSESELNSAIVPSGAIIRAHSGLTWVTLEGDGRDYLLRPGQAVRAQSLGRAVFQNLKSGSHLHIAW